MADFVSDGTAEQHGHANLRPKSRGGDAIGEDRGQRARFRYGVDDGITERAGRRGAGRRRDAQHDLARTGLVGTPAGTIAPFEDEAGLAQDGARRLLRDRDLIAGQSREIDVRTTTRAAAASSAAAIRMSSEAATLSGVFMTPPLCGDVPATSMTPR